jgi:hypothetical protein
VVVRPCTARCRRGARRHRTQLWFGSSTSGTSFGFGCTQSARRPVVLSNELTSDSRGA